MPAVIKSSIAAKPDEVGVSREDLESADIVSLEADDLTPISYAWALMFTPTDVGGTPSAAVLSAAVGPGPITFTVDNEGSYLVRLITDFGTPAEDTQYVRLRRQTSHSSLRLIAAGEKRDGTDIVPSDATVSGWSVDQNYNIQKLESVIKKLPSNMVAVNAEHWVSDDESILEVDTTNPITIHLPPVSERGKTVLIKDSVGNADVSNITVSIAGGSIDGWGATKVLTTKWASITLVSNGVTTWYVM